MKGRKFRKIRKGRKKRQKEERSERWIVVKVGKKTLRRKHTSKRSKQKSEWSKRKGEERWGDVVLMSAEKHCRELNERT